MADLQHLIGSDLSLSPTGDLAVSSGTEWGVERVLRRLLTNAGDYIWHLDYGAGLPAFVGQPANAALIGAVTRSQMFKERAVSAIPAPVITVTAQPNGTVFEQVQYTDASTGDPVVLSGPPDALTGG